MTRTTTLRAAALLALPLTTVLMTGGALAAPGGSPGKPADGSVGRADDKDPKGQGPGDRNAGYECDSNRGVGAGNPAHTGCDLTPPPGDGPLDPGEEPAPV